MVKCYLSRLLGERRLKISDICRETGINRGTITRLYHETASRIDLEAVDKLCNFLGCQVGDLFEHIDDEKSSGS